MEDDTECETGLFSIPPELLVVYWQDM